MNFAVQHREPWQQQLIEAIRDPAQLLQELSLPESLLSPAKLASQSFQLMVTRSFMARMEHGNASDPLLAQVLPVSQ